MAFLSRIDCRSTGRPIAAFYRKPTSADNKNTCWVSLKKNNHQGHEVTRSEALKQVPS